MRDVIESRNGLICYSEKRREKPSWVRRKKAEIERSRAGRTGAASLQAPTLITGGAACDSAAWIVVITLPHVPSRSLRRR
jgi:hypothetical protein